ncbi:hypothetical protein VOLCADRAFT_103999 [Volvox carteri f. nagariensis]|uniref:Uncharacterized protein n=1 Tax=Volvox carteri f. nagariensis TaxID=3068 RepID=D8TQJ9_VOLCA|nr:uncharacterized protein VOLCADRAFT_103999 [Volvox carteri f. nagariensis]EFJ50046.1 hypothetical protein VOLCADRAFT_103999 [Volvox carteri f. nagariensis]|eukprot:XP_002948666.1 hypothetical protein VOLCADRAFT_103999 [Volvox carteri f. nagariensis]
MATETQLTPSLQDLTFEVDARREWTPPNPHSPNEKLWDASPIRNVTSTSSAIGHRSSITAKPAARPATDTRVNPTSTSTSTSNPRRNNLSPVRIVNSESSFPQLSFSELPAVRGQTVTSLSPTASAAVTAAASGGGGGANVGSSCRRSPTESPGAGGGVGGGVAAGPSHRRGTTSGGGGGGGGRGGRGGGRGFVEGLGSGAAGVDEQGGRAVVDPVDTYLVRFQMHQRIRDQFRVRQDEHFRTVQELEARIQAMTRGARCHPDRELRPQPRTLRTPHSLPLPQPLPVPQPNEVWTHSRRFAGSPPLRGVPTTGGLLFERYTKKGAATNLPELQRRAPRQPGPPTRALPNGIPASRLERLSARRRDRSPPRYLQKQLILLEQQLNNNNNSNNNNTSGELLRFTGAPISSSADNKPPTSFNIHNSSLVGGPNGKLSAAAAGGSGAADLAAVGDGLLRSPALSSPAGGGFGVNGPRAMSAPSTMSDAGGGALAQYLAVPTSSASGEPLLDENFYDVLQQHFRSSLYAQTQQLRSRLNVNLPLVLGALNCVNVTEPQPPPRPSSSSLRRSGNADGGGGGGSSGGGGGGGGNEGGVGG